MSRIARAARSTAPAGPFITRSARAAPVDINVLAWYDLGEPDRVEAFEATHNVEFEPGYYAGGDNLPAIGDRHLAEIPPHRGIDDWAPFAHYERIGCLMPVRGAGKGLAPFFRGIRGSA